MIAPAVVGIGGALDQAARLERRERRAHRLRADLLEPGERGRRGWAAAVEPGERRALRQRELVARGDLTQPPQQQADAEPERRSDLGRVERLGDFISLD